MSTVVRMPQLAAGGESAAIQSWLVAVGDPVRAGQPIAEIETEKAVVEYEADVEGILAGTLVAAGDAASVGSPIAVIAAEGETLDEAVAAVGISRSGALADASVATRTRAVAPAPTASMPVTPAPSAQAPGATSGQRLFVSPLVRRLAAAEGVDLAAIRGTGPNGRIVRRDLDIYLAERSDATEATTPIGSMPAAAASPPAAAGYTDIPHTGMRRAIARRLTESKTTVPHFYLTADCRVDALLALRAQVNATGVKVSVNDLVVKAVARALRDVPAANAIFIDEATRRFDAVDLAIAISVPNGLVTPVVRGVDRMSVTELSAQIRDVAERARDGKLRQNELEGGSFSVSNLGMYGTPQFAAIINPPHAGILAVGAAAKRPVVTDDDQLAVATVMTVTLSADHRVLDGALAAEWLAAFVRRIEEPLSILL
ncbi:dihydrolipoamide acetyltransferase family protein [Microbacterium sp.]|uniref:dihydrolipoamide acetyltransferase family protein n=1 Tax=Microbacterium sp. TaxID=51671 RepID=UPI003A8CFCE5